MTSYTAVNDVYLYKVPNTNVPGYNPFLVYCRELAPGTISLTGDRAQGDDSKHDSHYSLHIFYNDSHVSLNPQ